MIDMNEQEELKNLLDAQKKINARIKELRMSKKEFGLILIQRHPTNNRLWSSIHQIKIKKFSCAVESEQERCITIIESNNMVKSLNYLKKIRKDIDKLIDYLEGITVKDPNGSGREDK